MNFNFKLSPKLFVLLFLFVVATSIFTPYIVNAQAISFPPANACNPTAQWIISGYKSDSVFLSAEFIAYWLIRVLIWGAVKFILFSEYVLSTILSILSDISITNKDGLFYPAWVAVRDLGNMVIVLGFVVVGIATALRFRDYEAKKLLLPLIIAALLINFSPLFCGLIIDATHIIMHGLPTNGAVSGNAAINIIQTLKCAYNTNAYVGLPDENLQEWLGLNVLFIIITILSALIIFYLAILLVVRYVALGILFILSPLAFTFRVFPATEKLWKDWWNHFLKWAFAGVGIIFFLWLATQMFANSTASQNTMLKMIIALIVMLVGAKMTTKASGLASMAATAAIGIATGGAGLAVGLAGGMAKGGVKMADRATNNRASTAVQNLKSGTSRVMERIGLKESGSTRIQDSQRVDKALKPMAAEYASAKATGDTATVERIQNLARNGKGDRGAAAMRVVSDNKDLSDVFKDSSGKLDTARLAQRITYAESVGASGIREQEEKRNPHLRAHNNLLVDKKMKESGLSYTDAQKEVVSEGFQKLDVSGIRDLPKGVISAKDDIFVDNVALKNPKKLGRAVENMAQDKIEEIKKLKYKPGKKMSEQTPEYQALWARAKALPKGSPEQRALISQIAKLQAELSNNSYLA